MRIADQILAAVARYSMEVGGGPTHLFLGPDEEASLAAHINTMPFLCPRDPHFGVRGLEGGEFMGMTIRTTNAPGILVANAVSPTPSEEQRSEDLHCHAEEIHRSELEEELERGGEG